jgi:hypothetical protein
MIINALSNARRSLQVLVQKTDPAAKKELTAIADALEGVEDKLKALEAVVEALAISASQPTGTVIPTGDIPTNDMPAVLVDWSYVKKLLGGDRI